MAHPKRRTSITDTSNTKRSLEYAGKAIDLINRTFSRDTESNKDDSQRLTNIETLSNENLVRSSYDRNKNKPDSISPDDKTLTMQIFKRRQYGIPSLALKGKRLNARSK